MFIFVKVGHSKFVEVRLLLIRSVFLFKIAIYLYRSVYMLTDQCQRYTSAVKK